MSQHTMKAHCPFGIGEIEVEITFEYTKGCRAILYGTPQPADPEQVDFISAACPTHSLDTMMSKMVEEWAENYLSDDDGYDRAATHACERE